MKNKEIEELLNDIKEQLIIDEKLGKEIAKDFHKTILSYEATKLLLSYIEQLEKRNKELYEGFMATQEELTDYATENEQLKKQKDDVVEYIKSAIENDDIEELKESRHLLLWNEDLDKLLKMLGEKDVED